MTSCIKETLKEKNITIYRLTKASELPYATVNDICSGKERLEKCNAGKETLEDTVKKLIRRDVRNDVF